MILILTDARKRTASVALALIALTGLGFVDTPLRPAQPGEELLDEDESAYQYLRLVRAPAQGPEADGRSELLLRINEGVAEYHSVLTEGTPTTVGKYYDTLAVLPALIASSSDERLTEGTPKLDVLVLGSGRGNDVSPIDHAVDRSHRARRQRRD